MRPRVAFVAGGLGKGGAEKQLVYMARALTESGLGVRVYSLTRGEHYETALEQLHVPVVWVGEPPNPVGRLNRLARELRAFRPDVVHSSHFFTNLYAALLAPLCDAAGIGSLRNDVTHELEANGGWGRWLLHLPRGLVANSHAARRNAEAAGVDPSRIRVVPNVIDPSGMREGPARAEPRETVVVVGVARLVGPKRLDRFLTALARARLAAPALRGVIVGDGPERVRLLARARALGLHPGAVTFTGHLDDVRPGLAQADMLLLTSEHEGFPNVLLEAMAAGLPVVTTPAGDAAVVVENGVTGFVVPHEPVDPMAERLVELARSADLRRRLGEAGRARAMRYYAYDGLGGRLLAAYGSLAERQRRRKAAGALHPWRSPAP